MFQSSFFLPLLLLATLSYCSILFVSADIGDLIQLTVLNRHGHRAPSIDYWKYCPNDNTSRKDFRVDPGGLTDIGFSEEYQFGEFLQEKYGHFYGKEYNSAIHYVRAVGEPRTVQSAMSVTESAFPPGYGQAGLKVRRGQFVPVFQDLVGEEHLISDSVCKKTSHNAAQKWMSTKGKEIIADQGNELLKEVYSICGTPKEIQNGKDVGQVVKDITDAFVFARKAGINTPGDRLSGNAMWRLRELSNSIIQGRLYGTDKQKTFMAVHLPHSLTHKFNLQIKNPLAIIGQPDFVDTWKTYEKLSLFVGHREAVYAVAHFFGIKIRLPGHPPFSIPTATSLLFGLYNTTLPNAKKPSYAVRVTIWAPGLGERTLKIHKHCKSPHLCTLEEFTKIYSDRVKRTGRWRKLCHYLRCGGDLHGKIDDLPYDN